MKDTEFFHLDTWDIIYPFGRPYILTAGNIFGNHTAVADCFLFCVGGTEPFPLRGWRINFGNVIRAIYEEDEHEIENWKDFMISHARDQAEGLLYSAIISAKEIYTGGQYPRLQRHEIVKVKEEFFHLWLRRLAEKDIMAILKKIKRDDLQDDLIRFLSTITKIDPIVPAEGESE